MGSIPVICSTSSIRPSSMLESIGQWDRSSSSPMIVMDRERIARRQKGIGGSRFVRGSFKECVGYMAPPPGHAQGKQPARMRTPISVFRADGPLQSCDTGLY